MSAFVLALAIGIVAGSRAMTAPAAVSWAAHLGIIDVSQSWAAFLGYAFTPFILTAFALGEFVTDQLPSTPSRTVPVQFGTRLLTGGLSGSAIGASFGQSLPGALAGVVGAVIGTFGGRALRGKLAAVFSRDPPAAFLEDAAAIGCALLIVMALR